MKEMDLIVYAKRDEHNAIVSLSSNVFIDDFTDWDQVDKWVEGEDRYLYSHAGNGEYVQEKYGKSLYDANGNPNFKGDFEDITDDEKYEWYQKEKDIIKLQQDQQNMMHDMMIKRQEAVFLIELPDNEAATIPLCFTPWKDFIGKPMKEGTRVEYDCKLVKARQNIPVVLENQAPGTATAALYEFIDIEHEGTLTDPIPAQKPMEYFEGKYYLDPEDGKIYSCFRDSGTAIAYLPHELIDHYFKLA